MTNEELFDIGILELADICVNLWEQYFSVPKKEKPGVMDEYNKCAKMYNSRVGHKSMILIDGRTKNARKEAPSKVKKTADKGIWDQIISLRKAGVSTSVIAKMGYSRSTISGAMSKFRKNIK